MEHEIHDFVILFSRGFDLGNCGWVNVRQRQPVVSYPGGGLRDRTLVQFEISREDR